MTTDDRDETPEDLAPSTWSAEPEPSADIVPSTETSPMGIVDSLTVRSEAAAAVGSHLLASGMASYRVKDAMSRSARALGMESFTSVVSFTDIIATATMDGRYRTRVTQPDHVGVNVDHMHHTLRLVQSLPIGVRAADVLERLDEIRSRPPLRPSLLVALAAGVACGAFAFLNQGGIVEMLGALVGAFCGQAVRGRMQKHAWNHFLVTLIAAIVASSLYLTVVEVPAMLGWIPGGHDAGYLAAVLFLVPGFPMITGILDLVRADYSAGVSRLGYSALMISAAAAAVWTVGLVTGSAGVQAPLLELPFALNLPLRAIATFFGVVGFAIIFNSPWKIAFAAGGVSLVANTLRYVLDQVDVPIQIATFAATVVVGVLSYVIARWRHVPRTAVSVPAVVIMIPGYAMYASYALLNAGDATGSLLQMQEAVQVVFAAALGLALAHLATSPAWRRVTHPH